jgi:hypothetical protein
MSTNNKFLIILSSHITSNISEDALYTALSEFYEENIDVCISTHTTMGIERMSKIVKYVVYDSNNDWVYANDFFSNVDLLSEDNCSNGNSNLYVGSEGLQASCLIPGPEYSKPALSIIRNGVSIAMANCYEWVVYLEYDIPTPPNGFKQFIENKIELLKLNNKDIFYYEHSGDTDYLWGGFFIAKTNLLYSSTFLMKKDWVSDVKKWIQVWGNTPFEYCVLKCIREASRKLIVKKISEDCENIWGIKNYTELSRSYSFHKARIGKGIICHIYPKKINDSTYRLYLLKYNNNPLQIIKNLKVSVDNKSVLFIETENICEYCYNFTEIEITTIDESVKLEYEINNKCIVEKYMLKDLYKIHKYLITINF